MSRPRSPHNGESDAAPPRTSTKRWRCRRASRRPMPTPRRASPATASCTSAETATSRRRPRSFKARSRPGSKALEAIAVSPLRAILLGILFFLAYRTYRRYFPADKQLKPKKAAPTLKAAESAIEKVDGRDPHDI